MDMEKFLSRVGKVMITLGTIFGFILIFTKVNIGVNGEEFSTVNIALGVGFIISSALTFILCEWLNVMLENSEEQIELLKQIRDKLEKEEW